MPTRARVKRSTTPTVKLGDRREVRLPEAVARQLRLRRGTELTVVASGDCVHLVPTHRIPKDQRYFYTPEWQAKEREADEDIRAGRVKKFANADELIRDLRGL